MKSNIVARVFGVEALGPMFPGFAVSALIATTAQFLSEHYGAPAMLMALLLGLALNFLSDSDSKTALGIEFTARTVLRLGAGQTHEGQNPIIFCI
jgi:uncharacterized membrane protein YadS